MADNDDYELCSGIRPQHLDDEQSLLPNLLRKNLQCDEILTSYFLNYCLSTSNSLTSYILTSYILLPYNFVLLTSQTPAS